MRRRHTSTFCFMMKLNPMILVLQSPNMNCYEGSVIELKGVTSYRPVMLKWLVMVSPVGVNQEEKPEEQKKRFITKGTSIFPFLDTPPQKSPFPPNKKNCPPIWVTIISGEGQKRPFRTVADWARPHTPLTLDPRSKVGTSTVTTLPEIWSHREIPKKTCLL